MEASKKSLIVALIKRIPDADILAFKKVNNLTVARYTARYADCSVDYARRVLRKEKRLITLLKRKHDRLQREFIASLERERVRRTELIQEATRLDEVFAEVKKQEDRKFKFFVVLAVVSIILSTILIIASI